MISASGTFAGAAKGSFAADKAIRALYLMSRHSTRPKRSSRVAGSARNSVVSSAVALIDKMTATLEGQICTASQYIAPPSAPIKMPMRGANCPVTRTGSPSEYCAWPQRSRPFALETARRRQRGAQIMTGIRGFVGRHLFRRADSNDAPAVVAALGPQVHDPVGRLD